ncbi:hypothetical protein NSP_1560 [Nodularia spumigena CCY9414]|nr:hypothetical protein NSP_1560 [Nodularia spumigena CCY9414]
MSEPSLNPLHFGQGFEIPIIKFWDFSLPNYLSLPPINLYLLEIGLTQKTSQPLMTLCTLRPLWFVFPFFVRKSWEILGIILI